MTESRALHCLFRPQRPLLQTGQKARYLFGYLRRRTNAAPADRGAVAGAGRAAGLRRDLYCGEDTPKGGYTAFFQRLQKLDVRLVDLVRVHAGGRTSEVVLRYPPEKVVQMCG